MKIVRFNDALEVARNFLGHNEIIRGRSASNFVLIRDLYGRFRLLCPDLGSDRSVLAESFSQALGSSADPLRPLLFDEDFFDSTEVRTNSRIQSLNLSTDLGAVPFLDRGVIGASWLAGTHKASPTSRDTKRVVFFGLKGGAGRTTALCTVARHYAKQGKKVLVVDVDLESPGLGSLLLPPEDLPDLGIIDWFMEEGLGQANNDILSEIIATSSLGTELPGSIRVAPAFGRSERSYIPKLSRVYAELTQNSELKSLTFAERFLNMLVKIEATEEPDIVLLDSRAGMHDIAATLLVQVPNALRLLFAHNSPQTWAGYRLLFEHWQAFPQHLTAFRDGLQMVDTMMPETERETHRHEFLTAAYALFSETLYEDSPPGVGIGEAFNFQMDDSEAPHAAPAISWDRKLMEFNPQSKSSPFHEDELTRVVFGNLLDCISERLAM